MIIAIEMIICKRFMFWELYFLGFTWGYTILTVMSLPIPQPPLATGLPGDLHYMNLEEAMLMQFTAEHQPFLVIKSARSRNTTVVAQLSGDGARLMLRLSTRHSL